MKTKLLLVTFLLSVNLAATFSAPQQQSGSASKILALEDKWNEAYKQGDVAAMNSLLTDDFIITVEDGTTFSRAGYIAALWRYRQSRTDFRDVRPQGPLAWQYGGSDRGVPRKRNLEGQAV
jgi:hypothetical protein